MSETQDCHVIIREVTVKKLLEMIQYNRIYGLTDETIISLGVKSGDVYAEKKFNEGITVYKKMDKI